MNVDVLLAGRWKIQNMGTQQCEKLANFKYLGKTLTKQIGKFSVLASVSVTTQVFKMLRPVDRCITTYILEGRIVSILSVKQPENFRLLASLDRLRSMELVNAM